MREGELFGLRWADVTWPLARYTWSSGSRRDPHAASPARQRRGGRARTPPRQSTEERLLLGLEWDDHGLVFPNTVGKPLHPSNFLQRSFYPLLERAGLPRVRFHDLRHSAATLLLGLGIPPKIVSEMLGPQPDRHHPGPILPRHGYHAAGGGPGL